MKGHTNNPHGRPRKDPADLIRKPARQLGRISSEDWAEIQGAAKTAGKSFTQWALEILLRSARQV